MKTCSLCKVEKDKTEFGFLVNQKDGLNPRCKLCRNEDYRQRSSPIPELVSEGDVNYKSLDFLGFPRYRIGDDGSLWSWKRMEGFWKKLVFGNRNKSHPAVVLCHDKVRKEFRLYHLVLFAFVGPRLNGMVCRHLDGNPRNNALSNLVWGTPKENGEDRVRHGRSGRGELSGSAKLTLIDVQWIRNLREKLNYSHHQLAEMFRVSQPTVRNILVGNTWNGEAT